MSAPPTPNPPDDGAGSKPSAPDPTDIHRILEQISADLPEERRLAFSLVRASIESRTFSGPTPPPEILREYEAILPGSADRIFTMAEAQQSHRIRLESLAVPARENRANRGQIFALIVALAGLAVAGLAISEGQQWAAIAIGGADLALLAGLFLNAKASGLRGLARKREHK